MTDAPAIELKDVSKRFRVRQGGAPTLKSAALSWLKGRGRKDFWALRDVAFSVRSGETLGIIGSNGAGKSTLLSLVAGTMAPTRGAIAARGTIASLLELGTGFHPDLTGRENVFLYGAVIGLTRRRMRERMEAIIDFAGIREFIDEPVKHYSSGMYVRLGFAVAVEVDPDILLVDEVLAVGDVSFQRRCLAKMDEFRRRGKTMLVVSHDLHTIRRMSDRILLLDGGSVRGLGDPGEVVGRYRAAKGLQAAEGMRREWGTGELRITGVRFMTSDGREASSVPWGEAVLARIAYRAERPIAEPVFGFGIADMEGRVLFASNTQMAGFDIPRVEGEGRVTVRIDGLALAAGSYLFSVSAHSADHTTSYHRLDNAFVLSVESDMRADGCCWFPCRWQMGG